VELDQLELLMKTQLQKTTPRDGGIACAVGVVGSTVAPLVVGGAAGLAGAGAIGAEVAATAALAPVLPGVAELVGITATSATAVVTVSAVTASATASLASAALAPSAASQVCPYANRDVYTLPPGVNVQDFVRQLADKLVQNGVRHVIPIHLVNNSFGGTAVYMDALNLLNFYENDKWFDGIAPSGSAADVDKRISSVTLPPGCSGAACVPLQAYPQAPQVNRIGLTTAGMQLINELKHRGMILDVSHMSDKSLTDTLRIVAPGCIAPGSPACTMGYPVMSSHTGVRETEHAPLSPPSKGTFRSERDLGRAEAQMIRDMGGMVGMGVAPTTVPSDCMGSTRSLGAEFGELLNDMRPAALRSHPLGVGPASSAELAQVRGIALGSDGNGMNGMTIPRFGDFACGQKPIYVAVTGPNASLFPGVVAQQTNALAYRPSGPSSSSNCVSATVSRLTGEAALVQSVAGTRHFEFNCDGLAHYGMLPDLFQDLRNATVGAGAFRPLMRSAEDVIEMWEKGCRLAASGGGGDACQ
jgi:microsomal dipeptidase-like Zn-dependent dipeptidase